MIVQTAIEEKLRATFTPAALTVLNESHMHSVPPNSETHFKVVVVSDVFADQRLVARHQAVNAALARAPFTHCRFRRIRRRNG